MSLKEAIKEAEAMEKAREREEEQEELERKQEIHDKIIGYLIVLDIMGNKGIKADQKDILSYMNEVKQKMFG